MSTSSSIYYLLATIGVDTAENGPSKVSMKWGFPNWSCTRHAWHTGGEILTNSLRKKLPVLVDTQRLSSARMRLDFKKFSSLTSSESHDLGQLSRRKPEPSPRDHGLDIPASRVRRSVEHYRSLSFCLCQEFRTYSAEFRMYSGLEEGRRMWPKMRQQSSHCAHSDYLSKPPAVDLVCSSLKIWRHAWDSSSRWISNNGVISTPAPIFSRVFQECSSAMIGYP